MHNKPLQASRNSGEKYFDSIPPKELLKFRRIHSFIGEPVEDHVQIHFLDNINPT